MAAVRIEAPESGTQDPPSLEGMDARWITALRYAEQIAESGHAVTDDVYAEMASAWSEGEIVEITLVAGLFSYFNRFNDALAVEVTR